MTRLPNPLSLYVHLPWCIKKCPYCDFNSHTLRPDSDQQAYVTALLNDLAFEVDRMDTRAGLMSIFIGGGTPSLFSGHSIERLLNGVNRYFSFDDSIEITLEANPGTAEQARFSAYRQAGINRLSIGIQSFNNRHLAVLGRIHDSEQAAGAVEMADRAQFTNLNLDMMHGLPSQTPDQAADDVARAISLAPAHISAYQLTVEPNTLFAVKPPQLPDEDTDWRIRQVYRDALAAAGYQQYEISAYSRAGRQCRHNLNYWQFGDYIGIGAGAHGKLSRKGAVYRTSKPRHPGRYMQTFLAASPNGTEFTSEVMASDLPLEYMMNRLRLEGAFRLEQFEHATGLDRCAVMPALARAVERGLLRETGAGYLPTDLGRLFLDDLLQLFLSDRPKEAA